ncbi:MAG TPA: hypothetical protein VGK00_11015 [Anaerolineales bacterium]|jgi:ribosomal protein L37AE/L43A
MSNPVQRTSNPLRSDFPRKITLLLMLLIDTAIGFYFLFKARPETHQLLRHLLSDLCLGLVAGTGTRFLFGRRNWFVRYISATASLIVGLLILGLLTHWRTGLGPLYFGRTTVDWTGLAQILLGMFAMFLVMRAWRRPSGASVAAPQVLEPPARVPASREVTTRSRPKRRRAKKAAPAGSVSINLPVRGEPAARPASTRKRTARPENKPAAKLFLRKPKVRLSRVEKHLCPYCLEPVSRKDPRGVVECEICHTLHHGDCWAIAGSCQVPHYTA